MAFVALVIFTLFTITKAGYSPYGIHSYARHYPTYIKSYPIPVIYKPATAQLVKHIEYDAPAKYDFAYGVHDPHSGDVKNQVESSDGQNVHGSYSLIDADGYKRTVEYTADKHNGFNAVVHREPLIHHHSDPSSHLSAIHSEPVAKIVAAPFRYLKGEISHYPGYDDH